jgi:hypothetical protein
MGQPRVKHDKLARSLGDLGYVLPYMGNQDYKRAVMLCHKYLMTLKTAHPKSRLSIPYVSGVYVRCPSINYFGGSFCIIPPFPPNKKNELGMVNEMLMMFMLGLPH